nr:oxyopinin 10b precursor [Oxyopes takobius]
MNFYSVAVLLLLALVYNASCTQYDESYEDLDDQAMEDQFDKEMAVEVLGIDDEDTLNALVNLMELEQPEEQARFWGLHKIRSHRRWPIGVVHHYKPRRLKDYRRKHH